MARPFRNSSQRRRRAIESGDDSRFDKPDLFGGMVTFQLRRLEPLVAWAVAGYTLWVTAVLGVSGAAYWAIALVAACIAGWGGMFPARVHATMLLRALLLLAGVLLLFLAPGSGGAAGPYFFGPGVVAIFYSLLLPRVLAIVVTALAVGGFGLACWLVQPVTAWSEAFPHGSFMLLASILAMVFGRSMRQSDQRAEAPMRDVRTRLYNARGFFVHGTVLLRECHRQGQPFSMALLSGSDLEDIRGLLGQKVTHDLFIQLVQKIGAVPGQGIAARIESLEFAVLLPGATADQATRLLQQRLGNPPKLEVLIDKRAVVVGLDLAVAQALDKSSTIEEIYESLHSRWANAPAHNGVRTQEARIDLDDSTQQLTRRSNNPTVPMPLTDKERRPSPAGERRRVNR